MAGGFMGFNVAMSGLHSAQKNLSVINHNIANVNTPGYSRQEAVQTASQPIPMYDGTGMVGSGSNVFSVKRIRDEYLDFKYWSEEVSRGEWETKRQLLQDLEVMFNEPSDNGFNTILDEFYSGLQELSKDSSNPSVRAALRERSIMVTKYFNNLATHFENLQEDINYRINAKVADINSLGSQIMTLNRQIKSAEMNGDIANDLRDERTLLVDKLSRLINIEAGETIIRNTANGKDEKQMLIRISGKPFVDDLEMTKLSLSMRDSKLNQDEDIANLYQIGWEDGNRLDIRSGELRGYLDMRDGNEGQNSSPNYKGIPFYIRKLNEFVRTFAKSFNEGMIDNDGNGKISETEDGIGHADGYGLDPDGTGPKVPSAQIRFFTRVDEFGEPLSSKNFIGQAKQVDEISNQYNTITAKNFSIAKDVFENQSIFAASSKAEEEGNIEVLNKILEIRHNSQMFDEGAPEDFMKSLVTSLGIDTQQAVRISGNQELIVRQIVNRKMADSGVSIDEEMGNMLKYQHAYSASAKMITTLAEIYDVLLNSVNA